MNTFNAWALLITQLYMVGLLSFMLHRAGHRFTRAILIWGATNFAVMLSYLVAGIGGVLPGQWGTLIANTLFAAAAIGGSYAILLAAQRKPKIWLYALAAAVCLVLLVFFTWGTDNMAARATILNAFALAIIGYTAVELMQAYQAAQSRHYLVIIISALVVSVTYAYRMVFAMSVAEVSSARPNELTTLVAYLINFALMIVWNIVFFILVSQRAWTAAK
jgi:hypothetical protein